MSIQQQIGIAVGIAALGTATAAIPTQAFTFTQSSLTDQQFNQLILDGTFSELFVAESRAGAAGTERELGINAPLVANNTGTGLVGGNPLASGQLQWTSEETVDFELCYNALTGAIAYTVDGVLLSTTVNAEAANGIFIRTSADKKNQDTINSSFSFANLMLDDGNGFQALPDLASEFVQGGNRDVDYLEIAGLSGSFTLKGEQTLSWAGTFPDRSRLAAQIKVGSFAEESVPEPMTMLGAVVAAGAGYSLKRRRDR